MRLIDNGCRLDTSRQGNKVSGRAGKHIIYTNHLPARGRPFIHPTLAREDVLSARRIQDRAATSEYVVSYTLGTDML